MKPRFQFTLRRAILSTTLIAVGFAALPLGRLAEDFGEYETLFSACCLVCLFALPGAGIGSLWGRPVIGVNLGLVVGAVLVQFGFRW